jgi:hypothetical protein
MISVKKYRAITENRPPQEKAPYEGWQLPANTYTLYSFGRQCSMIFDISENQALRLFEEQEKFNIPVYGSRPIPTKETPDRKEDFIRGFRSTRV